MMVPSSSIAFSESSMLGSAVAVGDAVSVLYVGKQSASPTVEVDLPAIAREVTLPTVGPRTLFARTRFVNI